MIGDIIDPVTKQHYVRDPRNIAKKAETYLAYTGIADKAYFGAEAEFFIFDNVRFDQAQQHGYYFIDAEEGRWNSGREKDNLGYRPRYKEGTSRFRPPIITRTCAAKWSWRWKRRDSTSSAITMRWLPAGRRKLTSASIPC